MRFNLLASASSLALGGFVVVAPQAAHATLTCAGTSCSETIDLGLNQTNFNLTATLDRFNLGAGFNLTSVVVSDGGTLTSNGTIKNNGGTAATFSYSGGLKLILSRGTGAPTSFPTLTTTTNVDSTAFTAVAPGATVTYTAGGPLASASQTITTPGFLSDFVGSGTFLANVVGHAASIQRTQQGNAAATVNTSGDPFVQIVYNYSVTTPPISAPEPASMTVLGAGLTGLGVLRRRRRT